MIRKNIAFSENLLDVIPLHLRISDCALLFRFTYLTSAVFSCFFFFLFPFDYIWYLVLGTWYLVTNTFEEPRTKNQEPRTKNQEPRTKNQEPRTNYQVRSTRHVLNGLPARHQVLRLGRAGIGFRHLRAKLKCEFQFQTCLE